MDRLLRPRSIAIVGASSTPGSFGESVLNNLEQAGFSGELHLINPKRAEIRGRRCLPSIDDLPDEVDCAVLAIPRIGVLNSVIACARRHIGGVIVFSAGFAESGAAGCAEQDELAKIVRENRMILEGPNCLGMVNFVDGIPLTFVGTRTRKMRKSQGIAIVSQSGAMAAVLGVTLSHYDLDVSFSVSTGNEAASGVEDYVEYLLEDPHTRVITMIVEQFRRPRKFLALASRARELDKHIVLLHPGSSSAARTSAATHTGAMTGDYQVMQMKVRHAGVVLVDTLEELADVSHLLIRCPSFPGRGAAVFTESGAFKALTLDFCEKIALPLPALSPAAEASLRQALPDFIPPSNPLDLTAQGLIDPDLYRRTLPPIFADEQYGCVILCIILTDEATSGLKLPPILEAIKTLKPVKPVIFAGLDEGARISPLFVEELHELGVPFFPSPERAFRAVARLTAFFEQSSSSANSFPEIPADLAFTSGVLPEYKSKQVLSAIGIAIPAGALARTIEEAQTIAAGIGFPVALKAQTAELSHKSDAGGVVLNLSEPSALSAGWHLLHENIARALPGLALDGVLVERMAKHGAELIVGARNDPDWGPVLLIGFGGVQAEAMRDVRLLPPQISAAGVIQELHQLRGSALLRGFRGSPPLDLKAVAEIVCRLGALMQSTAAINEVDINPVVVYPEGQGALALDALIGVA